MTKLHKYKAKVVIMGQLEEIPVYAEDIESAHDILCEEYGEDSVESVRTHVDHSQEVK